MKYKSGFKIEFRVLPLSFYPPLLKYTPRVTSRRHQSIANVVQYVFFRKRRGNKIITEWTYMLVWQFNTKHTTSVVSAVQWWLARLSTQCSLDCTRSTDTLRPVIVSLFSRCYFSFVIFLFQFFSLIFIFFIVMFTRIM